MTKEQMIHKLVSHSVQTALSESKRYWLSDLFERGFAGYRNYSADQLRRELQLRGLAGTEDELLDEDIEDDIEWNGDAEAMLDLQFSGNDD